MENTNLTREEFGHFIAEFEAYRDSVLEEMASLRQKFEELNEELQDLKKELKGANVIQSHSRLR